MADGDTLANALVGALVTILTTPFVPGAPLLGGTVSGYLQGGDSREGLKVGLLAGLLALLPLVVLLAFLGNLFLFVMAVVGPDIPEVAGAVGIFIALAVFLFGFLYVVALSALGGWVGTYLKTEFDLGDKR